MKIKFNNCSFGGNNCRCNSNCENGNEGQVEDAAKYAALFALCLFASSCCTQESVSSETLRSREKLFGYTIWFTQNPIDLSS